MPRAGTTDHYAVLGVPPTATDREIRAAYLRRAREVHPDAQPGRDTTREFQEVAAAYDVLGDPAARADYDQAHRPASPPPAAPRWATAGEPPSPPAGPAADSDDGVGLWLRVAVPAAVLWIAALVFRWVWSSMLMGFAQDGPWAQRWVAPMWMWGLVAAAAVGIVARRWVAQARPVPAGAWIRLAAGLVALAALEAVVVALAVGFVFWVALKISEVSSPGS